MYVYGRDVHINLIEVLSSIPVCHFLKMLRRIANLIKKRMDFLWDKADEEKHYHLINWKVVSKPKNKGG